MHPLHNIYLSKPILTYIHIRVNMNHRFWVPKFSRLAWYIAFKKYTHSVIHSPFNEESRKVNIIRKSTDFFSGFQNAFWLIAQINEHAKASIMMLKSWLNSCLCRWGLLHSGQRTQSPKIYKILNINPWKAGLFAKGKRLGGGAF